MFKDNLVSVRKMHGFSQDELAEKIGVSRQTLSIMTEKTAIILVWVFHQRESMFLESRKWERKVRL